MLNFPLVFVGSGIFHVRKIIAVFDLRVLNSAILVG